MTDPTTPSTPEPTTPPTAATPPAYSAPAATPPAYAPAQPAYGTGAPAKYNTLSIVGFILAFFVAIAGLIVSIIAYRQIGQTGEQGKGLALAGIIISALGVFLGIIWAIFIIIGFAAAASNPYN